jgi:MFS transporter, DHA1 family, multidrug resistance protein B
MKFKEFHPNIKIRIIESFLSGTVGGMIFPFMAIYLNNYFGLKVAGLLLLINVFAGIVMNFLGGYFADHFGRKKIMLLAETVRFAAFFTMMISNSPWFTFPLVTFFMLTVNSIAWGLAGPATQAMLIDVSSPEERKLMYSITYWASNLSIAIGGILGAFLFKDFLFELFLSLTLVAGVVVLMVLFLIKESHPRKKETVRPLQHIKSLLLTYKSVATDRTFILFVTAGIMLFSMELQLTNYIGIRLSNEMPSQQLLFWEIDGIMMLGILRSVNTILVVILMLFSAKLSMRYQDRSLLLVSCSLFIFGYTILSYSNNVWVLLIMMILLTIGEVFRIPVEQSYMASIPPDNARSSYMAVLGLKFNISLLIASLTITISAYIPSLLTSIFIFIVGLSGTTIYYFITPNLDQRKSADIIRYENVQ